MIGKLDTQVICSQISSFATPAYQYTCLASIMQAPTLGYHFLAMEVENFDKTEFLKKLGENIARIRKSRGYSQDRVCLEAGLSRGALSKIESGKVEPRISTLALIALTIEVTLSKLINVDLSK